MKDAFCNYLNGNRLMIKVQILYSILSQCIPVTLTNHFINYITKLIYSYRYDFFRERSFQSHIINERKEKLAHPYSSSYIRALVPTLLLTPKYFETNRHSEFRINEVIKHESN